MELAHFFITYFLFLLASSVVITAFFCVTRGYTETNPDGTERRYGKILKGYYFFWFKERGKKLVWYTGDELAGLVHKIKEYCPEPLALQGDPFSPGSITKFETTSAFAASIPVLRNKLEVKFRIEGQHDDKVLVSAYSEDTVYLFPEWLRTVMAGCITCTPTVYGNIVYWSAIFLFKDTVLYDSLFGCFVNVPAGIIAVWLTYWISLAWLNTVLWNIYDK